MHITAAVQITASVQMPREANRATSDASFQAANSNILEKRPGTGSRINVATMKVHVLQKAQTPSMIR